MPHLGGVNHEGHPTGLRVSHQQVDKSCHGSNTLNQAVIHINVQQVSTLLYLIVEGLESQTLGSQGGLLSHISTSILNPKKVTGILHDGTYLHALSYHIQDCM